MAFDYTQPVTNSELLSQFVRLNFQSLSTFHRGPAAPPSPQLGYAWLDTADADNWKLKWYVEEDGTPKWVLFISHLESVPVIGSGDVTAIPFYEGANPPPMINLDDYDFEDAAGFSSSADQDIIFRVPNPISYKHGVKFRMRYCMSAAGPGNVRLKLDYRIKELGGDVGTGVEYDQTWTITPTGLPADELFVTDEVQIPDGKFPELVEIVHCRLTRIGTDLLDTHTGQFCLATIQPFVL